MKVERVSYDVMTPSAARGILEAILWKPAIRWAIDRIHVLNEIRYANIRRNEISKKISSQAVESAMKGQPVVLCQYVSDDRQQRAALVLKDVAYIIEAHFTITDKAGEGDTPEKFYNMALRRLRDGQCFHRPYLGCREFPAHFGLCEEDTLPPSPHKGEQDLGMMLLDIDFQNGMEPCFFNAVMRDGVINIPPMPAEGGTT
jgi:CRISPR-associated protein Cas5d